MSRWPCDGELPQQHEHAQCGWMDRRFRALLPLAAAALVLGACSSVRACAGCGRPGAAPGSAADPSTREPAQVAPPFSDRRLDMRALERELKTLRRGGKTQVHYLPASSDEWTIYADWVTHSARAAATGQEPPPSPRGFGLIPLSQGALWLLAEDGDLRRGAGAVVLRVGPARELVVQAPHTFFDSHTLTLALALFERSAARALMINTAHRANVAKDLDDAARDALARSGELTSDVAHADDAFFTSAHAALVRELPRAPSVQIHGYRNSKSRFDAVISGSDSVFEVAPLVSALREVLPEHQIAAYPHDSEVLGGVTNAQAKVSRRYATPFVHLELSRSLRGLLIEQPELRARFLDTLWRALLEAG